MTKTDQIFDILLKDKKLKLSDDHRLLKPHEIKEHGHITNECMHFRDIIQKGLAEGRLKFSDKKPKLKVDT